MLLIYRVCLAKKENLEKMEKREIRYSMHIQLLPLQCRNQHLPYINKCFVYRAHLEKKEKGV